MKMRLLLLVILIGALSSGAKKHSAVKSNKRLSGSRNLSLRKDLAEMKEEIKQLGTDHASMMHSMDNFWDILRQGWKENPTKYDSGEEGEQT